LHFADPFYFKKGKNLPILPVEKVSQEVKMAVYRLLLLLHQKLPLSVEKISPALFDFSKNCLTLLLTKNPNFYQSVTPGKK